MSDRTLQQEYQVVSIEMSNPFATLGDFSLQKFRKFADFTTQYTQKALAKVDTSHHNGLYTATPEVDKAIQTKKVIYSDWQPINVYVPSFLKPSAKMLEYALSLRNDCEISNRILQSATQELESILLGYLGDSRRLNDPVLIISQTEAGYSLVEIEKALFAQRAINEKLITTTGTQTVRTFKDSYLRVNDYLQTNVIAKDINVHYKFFIDQVQPFMTRVSDVNRLVAKLIEKINQTDGVVISGQVADYITKQIYRLAFAAEYVGSTMYNAQVFLKAISDTNLALQRSIDTK